MEEMKKILVVAPLLVLVSCIFGFDVAGIVASVEVFTLGIVQSLNYWVEHKTKKASKK